MYVLDLPWVSKMTTPLWVWVPELVSCGMRQMVASVRQRGHIFLLETAPSSRLGQSSGPCFSVLGRGHLRATFIRWQRLHALLPLSLKAQRYCQYREWARGGLWERGVRDWIPLHSHCTGRASYMNSVTRLRQVARKNTDRNSEVNVSCPIDL